MQNNSNEPNADSIAAQADSILALSPEAQVNQALEAFLASSEPLTERANALREVTSSLQGEGPRILQAALIMAGSGGMGTIDRQEWLFLWGSVRVPEASGIQWGSVEVALANLPLLVKYQRDLNRWLQGFQVKGPLDGILPKLEVLPHSDTGATFVYRAPEVPPVSGPLPQGLKMAQDEIDIDLGIVEQFMSDSGACQSGTAEFLRELGVSVSGTYDWESYDGCLECAQNDPYFDPEENGMSIEEIDYVEDTTITREEAISAAPGDYEEAVADLFGSSLDWTEPEECLETIQGMVVPEDGARIHDGARFEVSIRGTIHDLDLDEETWTAENMVDLTLALAGLAASYGDAGLLPPMMGTLTSSHGESFEWNGERLRGAGVDFTQGQQGEWCIERQRIQDGKINVFHHETFPARAAMALSQMGTTLNMGR